MSEGVLVVGATGNIGIAAVKGALRSGRQVLAIVRNQASADELYKNVGTSEGIDIVEASVTSDIGVKSVVDQVKAGKLPPFQHNTDVPLKDITTERLRKNMNISFETNFCMSHTVIPLSICRSRIIPTVYGLSRGDIAMFALPATGQGPSFSMATAAAREDEKT
ncbi:hypothetical protein CCMA1212_001336 [Trichoderma ghanense]|uniref:NmrA-like domain-containing protein n=1 Tax=Trichoderma ghanense TaxID=65468 RepID=A0ABY2HL96_9HYPO